MPGKEAQKITTAATKGEWAEILRESKTVTPAAIEAEEGRGGVR